MGTIRIKPGREKPLRQFHPWIFSGAIAHADAELGGLVTVRDSRGKFLATGYYNRRSQINVRILTWDESEIIDTDWWRKRLEAAIEARQPLVDEGLTAYRLVYAESDGLPGLIVDKYGEALVIQSLTLGIEQVKPMLIDLLDDLLHPSVIVERSDVDVRHKEGLKEFAGVIRGNLPDAPLTIDEYGLRYPVDLMNGHKTGFYLDQRGARQWLIASRAGNDRDVLNAFCYTGAFSMCAASTGAKSITNIDTSQPALDLAAETLSMHSLARVPTESVCADVFQQLRQYREQERRFDLIILDPPKFAHSAKDVERAARGYKDINLLAFQLLRPGGLLMTFSCSGSIDADLFQKIVFGASADAGRQAQIIHWLAQGLDHPVRLSFPEGRYLKGMVCRAE